VDRRKLAVQSLKNNQQELDHLAARRPNNTTRHHPGRAVSKEGTTQMKQITSLAVAAVLGLMAIVDWPSATHSSNVEPSAASDSPIAPFELMTTATDLPHQQYDAH
jgi:hypothetical protein